MKKIITSKKKLDLFFEQTHTRPQSFLKWLKKKDKNNDLNKQFFCYTKHYRFGLISFLNVKLIEFTKADYYPTNKFNIVSPPIKFKDSYLNGYAAGTISSIIYNEEDLRKDAIKILENYIKNKKRKK